MWKNWNSHTPSENVILYSHFGKLLCLPNLITCLLYDLWPSNVPPGHISQHNEYVHKKTHTRLLIQHFYNSKNLKATQVLISKKLWYIHTMQYYWIIIIMHTNGITTRWMTLKYITLSKINQTPKDHILYDCIEMNFKNSQN